MPVPTIAQVKPGAQVSIVLKADQPTGREVQGRVGTVLTNGNHPRGIKVQLDDGRVGRVQRMGTSSTSTSTSAAASAGRSDAATASLDQDGLSSAQQREQRTQQHKYQDARYDGYLERPAEQLDLAAYIKPAKQKKRGKSNQGLPNSESQQQQASEESVVGPSTVVVSSCPVCNDFSGDEAAVAHHVNEHFA